MRRPMPSSRLSFRGHRRRAGQPRPGGSRGRSRARSSRASTRLEGLTLSPRPHPRVPREIRVPALKRSHGFRREACRSSVLVGAKTEKRQELTSGRSGREELVRRIGERHQPHPLVAAGELLDRLGRRRLRTHSPTGRARASRFVPWGNERRVPDVFSSCLATMASPSATVPRSARRATRSGREAVAGERAGKCPARRRYRFRGVSRREAIPPLLTSTSFVAVG